MFTAEKMMLNLKNFLTIYPCFFTLPQVQNDHIGKHLTMQRKGQRAIWHNGKDYNSYLYSHSTKCVYVIWSKITGDGRSTNFSWNQTRLEDEKTTGLNWLIPWKVRVNLLVTECGYRRKAISQSLNRVVGIDWVGKSVRHECVLQRLPYNCTPSCYLHFP